MGVSVADQVSSANGMNTVPNELILRLCCFLDPRSLEAFSCASRRFRELLNNETAWKNAFCETFKHRSFGALRQTWREEYRSRTLLLRQYQRGRGKVIDYDGRVGMITDIFHNRAESYLVVANRNNGLASVSDPATGKMAKSLLYPSDTRLTSADISAMALTKGKIIYGEVNGTVAINLLDKNGKHTDYHRFTEWHAAPVVTILCRNAAHPQNCAWDIVTGAMDGTVKLWNSGFARDCVATFKVSYHAIERLSWSEMHDPQLYIATANRQIFYLDLGHLEDATRAKIETLVTYNGIDSVGWFDVVFDHATSSTILADRESITKYTIQDGTAQPVPYPGCLQGNICQIAIDSIDYQHDMKQPGAGGRCFAVADDHGTIAIYNARDSCDTVMCISQQDCVITSLFVSSAVVAAGCHDGRVLLFNVLTMEALRPLANRLAKFERIAAEDPARTLVRCLSVAATRAMGILIIGGQIRTFNYEPPSVGKTQGKRRGLGERKRTRPNLSSGVDMTAQEEIDQELDELQHRKEHFKNDEARYEKFTGVLADNLNDRELVDYAKMLSMDSSSRHESASRCPSIACADEDLQRALRESLDVHVHADEREYERGGTKSTEVCAKPNFQEDLDMAIALSLSLN